MFDLVIIVPEGAYRFDVDRLVGAVTDRWPSSIFVPATGRLAQMSLGQLQVEPDGEAASPIALISPLIDRDVLDLEVQDDATAAELMSMVTRLPGFPDDGSVKVVDWADEIMPLRPGQTPADLLGHRM